MIRPSNLLSRLSKGTRTPVAGIFAFALLGCLLTQQPAMADASAGDSTTTTASAAPLPQDFNGLARALVDADFDQKAAIARQIAAIHDARVIPLLQALVDSKLQSTADTPPRLIILMSDADDPDTEDALTGQALGKSSALTLTGVMVDNGLRTELHDILARLQLSSPEDGLRLAAAKRLITSDPEPGMLPLLESRLAVEKNAQVRAALETVRALDNLGSDDTKTRLAAIATLGQSLYPEVQARLEDIAANDSNATVSKAARDAMTAIKRKVAANHFAENVFFGLSLGSVLLLSAVGLAITFGVMGVINMAHGELMMLGAYTTYVMQQLMPGSLGTSLILSIPAAFVVSGLVGIAIERGVIRFLYGRPLETLLATFGISLILQQAVRTIFSPLNKEVASPSWMSGYMEINPALSLTYNRFMILMFALVVFFALTLILKRTSLGLKLRAVAQNRSMARAVGVRADWVDALTFGLGSGIAGIAGVALSQLTNVGPNLGQSYIIDSFMVVVFGGVGNLWGTLVGAFGLGIVNKFLEPYSGSVLAKILVLIFIILFIQRRPRGLFPQKGRAAEV